MKLNSIFVNIFCLLNIFNNIQFILNNKKIVNELINFKNVSLEYTEINDDFIIAKVLYNSLPTYFLTYGEYTFVTHSIEFCSKLRFDSTIGFSRNFNSKSEICYQFYFLGSNYSIIFT